MSWQDLFVIAGIISIIVLTGVFVMLRVFARIIKREARHREKCAKLSDHVEIVNRREEDQRKESERAIRQLKRANEKLQKLDDAKSEFIAIASHQLRTPVSSIKGYLSLLKEGMYGDLSPQAKDTINKMNTANERLSALVEDLTSISRIESGQMQYNFESVNLNLIIQELYDDFIVRAKDKGISFNIVYGSQTPVSIYADPVKIREVISDLIDNAIKYTSQGFVRVSLTADHSNATVSVEDTGMGIPKDLLPHLFTKFTRGKQDAKIHVDGIGLGLYTAKNIVEDHHGTIFVHSEGQGKGAIFEVNLPLAGLQQLENLPEEEIIAA